MKISRLKFYAAVIPLVASVSFANTKAVTVHAEEEVGQEGGAAQ